MTEGPILMTLRYPNKPDVLRKGLRTFWRDKSMRVLGTVGGKAMVVGVIGLEAFVRPFQDRGPGAEGGGRLNRTKKVQIMGGKGGAGQKRGDSITFTPIESDYEKGRL